MAFKMIRPMIKGSPIHKASIAKAKSDSVVANTRTSADPSLIEAADALGRSSTPGAIDYTLTSKDLKFRKGKKKKPEEGCKKQMSCAKGFMWSQKACDCVEEEVVPKEEVVDETPVAEEVVPKEVVGCMDPNAQNYNEEATSPCSGCCEIITAEPPTHIPYIESTQTADDKEEAVDATVTEEGGEGEEVATDKEEVIEPMPTRGYQQPKKKREIEADLQLATREAPVTPGYNDDKEVVTDVPEVEGEGDSTTGEVVVNPEGEKKTKTKGKNIVTKITDAIKKEKQKNKEEWDEKQLEKEKIKAQKELEKLEEAKAEAARLKDVETANALEAEIQRKKEEAVAKEAEAKKIPKALDYESIFEDETSDLQAPEVDFTPRPKSDIKVDPGPSPEEIKKRKQSVIEIPPIATTQLPTDEDEELMLPTAEAPKSSEILEASKNTKYKYDPNTMTTIEGQPLSPAGTTKALPPDPETDYKLGVVKRSNATYGKYKYQSVTMKDGTIEDHWTYNNNVITEAEVDVDAYTHIMQQQVDDQNEDDKEKEEIRRANDPILKSIKKKREEVIGPKQAALQMRDDRIWRNATEDGTVRQSMRNNGYVPFNER